MKDDAQLVQEVRVPGGHGRAFEVHKGQWLEVVDVEGGQVADLFAFNLQDHNIRSSPPNTRISLRSLSPKVGDAFYNSIRYPMLKILHDTSPSHDLLIPACDEQRYLVDYGVQNHRSCVANVEEALQPYGIGRELIPEPINLFQSTRIEADGTLVQKPCSTQPGDHIVMEAMEDMIVVISACPMDLNPIGGDQITDILARVYQPS